MRKVRWSVKIVITILSLGLRSLPKLAKAISALTAVRIGLSLLRRILKWK